MTLQPRTRKLILVAHVSTTLGWLGAVMAFAALAVVGRTSDDERTVRGALLVMEPLAWYVLVPLALASFVIGVIQSLGTRWGLLRYYWIIFKILITLVATVLLLNYMSTFARMADIAADQTSTAAELRAQATSPLLHSILAIIALLLATILAIYKPAGRTRLRL